MVYRDYGSRLLGQVTEVTATDAASTAPLVASPALLDLSMAHAKAAIEKHGPMGRYIEAVLQK